MGSVHSSSLINDMIYEQLIIFGYAFLFAVVAAVVYDLMRIFRRVMKHNRFFVGLEDGIYFLVLGLSVFVYLYRFNYGQIRMFIILAFGIGAIIYYWLISRFVVNGLYGLIMLILNPIKGLIKWIFLPIKYLCRIIFKWINKIKIYLIKFKKYMIIKSKGCLKQLINLLRYY